MHTYIHTYIHTCMHTYSHYIHAYIHTYILAFRTYTHTHIHTYIHTCMHTKKSRPFSLCSAQSENACNSDGVSWAKTLQGRGGFSSSDSTAKPSSTGEEITVYNSNVYVSGTFRSVNAKITRSVYGLTTPGVDDTGFVNMGDRNVESFVMLLSAWYIYIYVCMCVCSSSMYVFMTVTVTRLGKGVTRLDWVSCV
jgi:hypothetical protein